MESKKPEKRKDLQGIRGLAIISVLGFHFYPKWVPNGYLGVDQFFVLSGYLMCMLLKKGDQQYPCTIVSLFYSKRLKRILPLYLMVIFLALLSLYSIFPEVSWKINKKSAGEALIFMSNRGKTAEEDYFQILSIAIDLFTHTWSLSVEIQFYLMIPFIFIFGQKFSKNFQYFYYVIIALTSYIYSTLSSPTVAFNSVFARIWQFLIGFLVYLYTSSSENFENSGYSENPESEKLLENDEIDIENDPKPDEKSNFLSHFLIFGLIFLTFFPFTLDSRILRPIVTISSGILIFLSKNENKFLENRVLIYFGDISYVLYLVHWPIYAYWKLTMDGEEIALLTSVVISIIIPTVIHETYEKWYLRQASTTIGLLTVILFLANVILINKDEIIDQIFPRKLDYGSFDRSARLNHFWNLNDYNSLFVPTCNYEGIRTPFGWCEHDPGNLTGNWKIMIIGNSWTANHASMFHQECGHLAKSIIQGAASACEPLYPTRLSDVCKANFTDFEKHVRIEKPDYVFMFTRFVTIGDVFPSNVTNINDDPMYKIMKTQMLKIIDNIKQKMYILQAMPRPNIEIIEKIVPMLRNGVEPERIDTLLVNHTLYQTARLRYAQLAEDCGRKCVLVDYDPEFWNEKSQNFRFFDEKGLSYFTTTTHLTPKGIEKIRHVWRDICRSID